MSEKYVSLIPQYDEYGGDSGMEMLVTDGETFPNLIISRDYDHWDVAQVSEFWCRDEDGYIEDEYIEKVGSFPVAYEGVRFMRSYSEEETNAALLKLLNESEFVWSC